MEIEGVNICHRRHPLGQESFDICRNLHIENHPARRAHEMVMVAFEILREFERCPITIGEHLDDHSC